MIKSKADYEAALIEVESLMLRDPRLGTVEADRLEFLAVLIQDYEKNSYKMDDAGPVAAIEFRMAE